MITEENRPTCIKECGRPAMLYMDQMWICGECYHQYSQRKIKENQKLFLEG